MYTLDERGNRYVQLSYFLLEDIADRIGFTLSKYAHARGKGYILII
jgi:hypothetical protein